MKKIISLIMAVVLIAMLQISSLAHFEPETNYMSQMIDAAQWGDVEAGAIAETSRDEKISELSMDYKHISFEDLYLLSKIIYAEAGSDWLSDEWKMSVGEVVLNRRDSSLFPDRIADVLNQPGQYYGAGSTYFNNLQPSRRCVELAQRLLEGERLMESNVVFQANFQQGSGVYRSYYDELLGWSYFCYI